MGFGVWGVGFGVWGLGFGVWGLGFGIWGFGLRVWGLGFRALVSLGLYQLGWRGKLTWVDGYLTIHLATSQQR